MTKRLKGMKPLGLGGLGLGLLYFVLESADLNLRRGVLVTLGVLATLLILYGFVGWVVQTVTATSPVKVAIAGYEVTTPLGWPVKALNDWRAHRLTLILLNDGEGRNLEVVALQGMDGIFPESVEGSNPKDYGNFFLQWDLHKTHDKWIPAGTTWKLHVFAGKDQQIIFLGPPGDHYHYRHLNTFETISFQIAVRESNTDRSQVFGLTVSFDEDGKPNLVRHEPI